MSWVTILWSLNAGVCLTLAAIYLLVWSTRREDWVDLLFSCTAISVAVIAGFEFAAMHSETTEGFGLVLRWAHLPLWTLIVSLVWFVRFRLRAGRMWLAWSVCAVRSLALFLNPKTESRPLYDGNDNHYFDEGESCAARCLSLHPENIAITVPDWSVRAGSLTFERLYTLASRFAR